MASITGTTEERVFKISKWLGVNENPDGDTRLKMGEAAEMRNWRITADGSLQIRPGTQSIAAFTGPVRGLWSGTVAGQSVLICAADGALWEISDGAKTQLGSLNTDGDVSFLGFSEKVYVLNGVEYLSWDGSALEAVTGYRPLVSTAVSPGGGGTALESVNRLNGMRHCYFSPDGSAKTFQLPEKDLKSVDFVKDRATGNGIEHTADLAAGTVTFATAPPSGTNTIDIGYSVSEDGSVKVKAMRYGEIYNGTTDNRVFLYGDGTNTAIYSGLEESGAPTAEYFPDMNEIAVGEANTPITGMIRHMSRLIAFKPDSTWGIYYGQITLESGLLTAGFYLTPVNRAIGNAAPGQPRLVSNNIRTVHGGGCYEWRPYSGGSLNGDERNAKRISERVKATLGGFDLTQCKCFDDDRNQNYYILHGSTALVHNYAQDAWSIYEQFPVRCMALHDSELYGGTSTGRVVHISREYRNDDTEPIDAFWRSGSMDFDRTWLRKASTTLWFGMKPESNARVTVTARSDRKADHAEKVISASLSSFDNVDFAHWSFNTNRRSRIYRARVKVKKFALYQLILQSNSSSATCTIISADISVRYSGKVK